MSARTSTDSPLLFELVDGVPDLRFESEARKDGHVHIAGADEAGRGPLAGPVVAAAVILDISMIPDGLNDSKQLTRARREELFVEIMASAIVSIASSGASTIDSTDIRKASLDAMRRAIAGLPVTPCFALFDGCDVPGGLVCPGRSVIRGDARSLSIAAASIIAKVTRDRMMGRACNDHPAYGFSSHVGYGTPQHLAALLKHGASPIHRMSFRPLRKD